MERTIFLPLNFYPDEKFIFQLKKLILIYFILFNILFLSNIASAQKWWNNFAIQVGTTAAKPDTRLEYLYDHYPVVL
ncbi:MAG: hypothetical protein KA974_03670 [Saprospiraceae bacterium]|nr:hypothetical protein [Saprospiraceae bacterium]MBP7699521.1 hypothetical protein [Saprospiraceae bacterium]